jgi:hypothetical protein
MSYADGSHPVAWTAAAGIRCNVIGGTAMEDDYFVIASDLADIGLTPEDVRRLCPQALEYTSLDDSPCWRRDDLAELLDLPKRRD